MSSNLAHVLRTAAAAHANEPAISLNTKVKYDYRTLEDRVSRIAASLRNKGLNPGDRVAMVISNHPEFYVALFGIWHAGLVAVPVNAYETPEHAQQIVSLSGAKLCFVSPNLTDTHEPVIAELEGVSTIDVGSDEYERLLYADPIDLIEPKDGDQALAWLMFTSGTTGPPKGVMLSHGAVARNCRRFLDEIESVVPGDALIHVTSMSHGSGILGVGHIMAGANQVIPKSGGLVPRELIGLVHRWPRPRVCLAPAVLRMLSDLLGGNAQALAPLHAIYYGSAPMRQADIRRALAVFGPKLVQLYGLCEAPGSIACLSREDHIAFAKGDARLAPVGRLRDDVRLSIRGDDGEPLPSGTIGHIHCAMDTVMSGYWGNQEKTQQALQGEWLVTNDLGYVDSDGYLYLVGRRDAKALTAPDRFFPYLVEDRLSRHPDVRDCAVVESSEGELVAFASLVPGARIDEAAMSEHYADLSRSPTCHVQIGAMPYSATGKILRPVLRDEAGRLDQRWSEWQRFEQPPVKGFHFRLAKTRDDAEAIRMLVREAWQLADEDSYFYERFENPDWVHEHLIQKLATTDQIRDLDAIALIGEDGGKCFGTVSLVFDHVHRIVEIGRGAIRPSQQGASRGRRSALALLAFLEMVPDYNVVVDATLVHFGAGNVASIVGASPVGLYPTSFVFQKGCAQRWIDELEAAHGPEIVEAMVYPSPLTGMGRFPTAYHMRLAPSCRSFRPTLTEKQRRLFDWTRKTLQIQTMGDAQPTESATDEVVDMHGTATRSVFANDPSLNIEEAAASALHAGMETLILRVPCDGEHRDLAQRLDMSGAILGGVQPDARGYWSAGYVLPLGDEHYRRVTNGLRVLAERAVPWAYADLLRVVTGISETEPVSVERGLSESS